MIFGDLPTVMPVDSLAGSDAMDKYAEQYVKVVALDKAAEAYRGGEFSDPYQLATALGAQISAALASVEDVGAKIDASEPGRYDGAAALKQRSEAAGALMKTFITQVGDAIADVKKALVLKAAADEKKAAADQKRKEIADAKERQRKISQSNDALLAKRAAAKKVLGMPVGLAVPLGGALMLGLAIVVWPKKTHLAGYRRRSRR